MSPLVLPKQWDLETLLAAEFSTASLTPVNITNLKLALPASSLWEWEAVLLLNSSDTSGLKIAVNGPAGATLSYWVAGDANNNFPGSAQHGLATLITNALGTVGTGSDVICAASGFFKLAGTAGDLQMQLAKVTAGTAVARVASLVRARRIA